MANLNFGSINLSSRQLIESLGGSRLDDLDIRVIPGPLGSVILDFGVDRLGTLGAGKVLAEICLAGLGRVSIHPQSSSLGPLPAVMIETDAPLLACIGAQYAGWPLATPDYFAMVSGAARMLRGQEEILERYDLSEGATQGVLVLEAANLPTETAVVQAGLDCQLPPSDLTFCVARTASLPGTIQIVARSVETTLHKLFELNFDLSSVHRACGTCPLPPIGASDLQSIGWTNDAIILGSDVALWVDCPDEHIEAILAHLPSSSSPDFGKPFIEIFEAYGRDFYKIDKLLFSPARVAFNNYRTGRLFRTGELHETLFHQALGIAPNTRKP